MAYALLPLHRVLLAQQHARSRPDLNQSNHAHFSEAALKRFDQATMLLTAGWSHRDRCMPLRLTTIVTGILLSIMPFLTGCGGGGETGSEPIISTTPGNAGVAASLAWSPVQDPSVSAYVVHYGRHSPGQPGSCAYEGSIHAASPSVTITNLDPNTVYYFAVSAYNGLESGCSNEVSTQTPPAST